MTYLEDHPPARPQYRKPRRGRITGAIVLHDAENATDQTGPDTGAEAVARFIATRTTPGSYHTVVDSDSIVRLVPYDWEAFHEGTGGNRWSLGLSFAYGSQSMPSAAWWPGALRNGAIEARAMSDYVKATVGFSIPARRITADQYRVGYAGFISHAELDPRRRKDPVGFPWDPFLRLYAAVPPSTVSPTPQPPQENPMAVPQPTLGEFETFVACDFHAAENPDVKGERYWVLKLALADDWTVPAREMRRQLGLK